MCETFCPKCSIRCIANRRGQACWPDTCDRLSMTSIKDDAELKRIVTEKRRLGRLPQIPTPRAWAGNGNGELCSLCESPIGAGQIEYEVEWQRGPDTHTLRFHELCYRLWSNP